VNALLDLDDGVGQPCRRFLFSRECLRVPSLLIVGARREIVGDDPGDDQHGAGHLCVPECPLSCGGRSSDRIRSRHIRRGAGRRRHGARRPGAGPRGPGRYRLAGRSRYLLVEPMAGEGIFEFYRQAARRRRKWPPGHQTLNGAPCHAPKSPRPRPQISGAPAALSTLAQAGGLSWAPGATAPPLAPGSAA